MFELEGEQYSLEQVTSAAEQSNMPLEDYLKEYNIKELEDNVVPVEKQSDVVAKDATVTSIEPGQASENTELEQVNTSLVSEDPEPTIRRGRAQVRAEELERRDIAVNQKQIENSIEEVELSDSVFNNLSNSEKIKLQDIAVDQINLDYKSQGVKEYSVTPEEVDAKAVEILKEKNRPSVVKSYAAQGVRGFASFAKGLSEMGETVQYSLLESALDVFNPDYKGTVEEKQAIMSLVKSGALQMPSSASLPPSSEIGKFIEKLEPSIRKYEAGTITEDIEKGNYLQAGERAIGSAIESLPSIVAAATGVGGLVLLGGSVSGSKFMEEFEADPEKSTGVLLLNSGLSGVTEVTFEMVTRGILSKAKLLKDSGADKAAADLIRGGGQKLVSALGLNSVKEGGSEAATKVTTLLIDKYTLGKDIDWGKEVYNIVDEAIVGSVMGSGTTFAGAVANTDKAIVERAQMILTPSENKQQLIKSANNISKLYKDAKSADADGVKLINEAIKSEELNIVKIKKETAEALNNMSPAELKIYANNQNKLRKLRQQAIDPKTSESVKKLANDKFVQLRNENDVLFQESGERRIQRGVDVITEAAKKVEGVEVQSFNTTQEVEDFIKQQNPEADVKASQQQGFIVQNPTTGEQTIVINKEIAGEEKAMNIAGHEFGHAILFKTVKDSPKTAENLGNSLLSEINKIDAAQVKDSRFKKRLEQYSSDPKSVQMEEAITLFSDALATGDIKFNENVFTKIGDQIRRVMQSLGVKVKFNTGRDVYNFVKDYNRSIEKGKIGKAQIKAAREGVKGALVEDVVTQGKTTVKEAKSEDIQNEIEKLEDSYFDGEIDEYQYEQKLENLENKLKQAEKEPVKEKAETEVEPTQQVEKIVKEATTKVFEKKEVSDKNKQIAKTNDDIVQEMADLGANRISDIKDPKAKKAIVDKLGENNIGAVTELAKKAAATSRDLPIDDNLKVNYEEFFLGFSEELSALINSYKANVDGKKVPFGAYMNQNLRLRYGSILDRSLKGKLKGSESLSSDKNVKKEVGSFVEESSSESTSRDEGRVLEQIDVRKFGPAKDKVDEISSIVEVKEGERPTYKQLADNFIEPVSMELFDVPGKKIQGKATLTDAEAKSLQRLFVSPDNVRKLIKTMPPYNVATSETVIGEQGEIIDVSKDIKGRSIGLSNKFIKQFYQPVSRAIPGISSPKGRSLGETSQGQVYELKSEFKGRVSNDAVKQIQNSVGVTEAGVPNEKISAANRTKYGTTLTGFAKTYIANVINVTGRSKQTDKQEQADTGAGKARIMFSKSFNLGLENGSNVDNIASILFSKSARKKYEQVLKAKRPDLKDIPEQVDNLIKWADSLDIRDDKKAKYKKLGLFYMANGYTIFPEDGYKVTESIRLADINKIDPYSFKNPNELIEKYEKTTKIAKINPDSVNEFSNKEEIAGLTIYDVEDSKKGQEAVRKIVDSNWGKKSNPWCLVARVDGNLAGSFDLWKGYNKEGNGFKIAFNNGKLNSFRDGNDMQWWDRMDKPQKGPALKIKADPNGLVAEGYIDLKNGAEVVEGYKKDYKEGDLTIEESYAADKKLVGKYTYGKNKFSDKSLIAEYSFDQLDGTDYIETESKYEQDNSQIVNITRKFDSQNLHKKTLRKKYYDKNNNIIEQSRERDVKTGVIKDEIIFTDNNTGYGTFDVYKAETINGKKNVSIDERKRFIFSDNPFKFSKSLSIEKSLIQDFISQKPGKVSARKQNSYARTIKELLEYGGVNGVESFERAVELGNYTKDELDLINFVFEGRDWLFGIFQDDKTQNQGIKLEKLVKVAIKKLGLKDVNLDLSEGGFSSGVDIVLSVKDKKLNIELKLNEKARVGSFTIKRNGDVFSYTKGVEGIETELPALHKAIQEQLKGDKYQKAWKKYTEEGVKIGKKLLESGKVDIETYVNEETGQLVGPKEVFDYLKDPKKGNYQKDLTIKINQVDGKPIDQKIIELLYNNKDVYDINFGGVGMFALGESISGRPKLDANVEVRIVTSRASSNGIYRSIQRATPFILDINNTTDLDLADLNNVQPNIQELVESMSDTSSIKSSKAEKLDKTFNDILEKRSGIPSRKRYGIVEAITKGSSKGRFNFFIPPSAEDFVGLLYPTLDKGEVGDAQMSWYKSNLIDPYAEAMNKLSKARVYLTNNYTLLKKQLDVVPKDLAKKIEGTDYTREQAIRVYIWNKQKMDIPGISKKDVKKLNDFVVEDANLQTFADQLINLQLGDGYVKPKEGWPAGTITTDILEGLNTTKRAKYLKTWQSNVDAIFSEDNLNKLQAMYGLNYRKALENMLKRMKTGRNRSFSGDSATGRFTDWLTGSVGAIMFFNTRSAVLQTISAINFINFKDNNILAAGKAFANQKQYWADFTKLMNSDFLKERRGGLRINVNEADIADMAKKGGARGAISKLLELGFAPTQIADSFAIASGGSTFYRNRINTYKKQGLTDKQAEKKAFEDFRETAEESQQSSRADRISMQQASPLGRIVLAFANTPAQYARIIKKAASDLKNGRGDAKTNVSKIIYYGAAQNLIFNALQQALFSMAFSDEEPEDKEKEKKYLNIANGMLDSILRGAGIGGAIVTVGKNTVIKIAKELKKDRPQLKNIAFELAKISPPVSAKLSRLQQAGRSYDWNKQEMKEKGLSLDNPAYLAGANVVSALTNIPLDRAIKKAKNVVSATSQDLETWERIALLGGWQDWELGIKEEKQKDKPKPKRTLRRKVIKKKVTK